MPLTADLLAAAGDPVVLFCVPHPAWAVKGAKNHVSDGPFLHQTAAEGLLMLWSSSRNGRYCQAISYSLSGKLLGPWAHDPVPLLMEDAGHGMIFRSLTGELIFICHQPDQGPLEWPVWAEVKEREHDLILAGGV